MHECQEFDGSIYSELASLTTLCELVSGNTYRLKPINFPVAYNPNDSDFNVIGKTGGEKKHILTIDEMASHSHKAANGNNPAVGGWDWGSGGDRFAFSGDGYTIQGLTNTGGNQAHNNLPNYTVQPYIIKAFNE